MRDSKDLINECLDIILSADKFKLPFITYQGSTELTTKLNMRFKSDTTRREEDHITCGDACGVLETGEFKSGFHNRVYPKFLEQNIF